MDALTLLEDARASLGRNLQAVAAFVAGTTLIIVLTALIKTFLRSYVPEEGAAPIWLVAAHVANLIALSGGMAGLHAMCFAAMGSEIDRPLWKSSGHGDALHRFFVPWFILMLLHVAITQLGTQAAQIEELALLLALLDMVFFLLFVPIGACIMYRGRFEWHELPEALKPIARQLPLAALVVLVNVMQFILIGVCAQLIPKGLPHAEFWLLPVNLPAATLDCLAFAMMWRICMIHRDTPEEGTPFDF